MSSSTDETLELPLYPYLKQQFWCGLKVAIEMNAAQPHVHLYDIRNVNVNLCCVYEYIYDEKVIITLARAMCAERWDLLNRFWIS